MSRTCQRCGNQQLKTVSDKHFRIGIPRLMNFLQRKTKYACTKCGEVTDDPFGPSFIDGNPPVIHAPLETPAPVTERTLGSILNFGGSPPRPMHLQFAAAIDSANLVLYPTSEGNVQDGTSVDRFGEPDLMTEFAEEYLRQFSILMPSARLPTTLKELMPALLLLFAATELALKAYWIRSEKELKPNHSLTDLYAELDHTHKKEIKRRFEKLGNNPALSALGVDNPDITQILTIYSATYGGASSVHMDARYYPEPTTMFRRSNDLQGANLVKSGTPYPIFLPDLARALIDAYRFFSGSERLRRLGANIQEDSRDSSKGNHGEWGLVPSSLDLLEPILITQRL